MEAKIKKISSNHLALLKFIAGKTNGNGFLWYKELQKMIIKDEDYRNRFDLNLDFKGNSFYNLLNRLAADGYLKLKTEKEPHMYKYVGINETGLQILENFGKLLGHIEIKMVEKIVEVHPSVKEFDENEESEFIDGVVKLLGSEFYDSYDEIQPKETKKLERISKKIAGMLKEYI